MPVIRHWPGAETIYDKRWIRENPAEMAAAIAELSAADAWEAARQDAYQDVQAFELGTVAETWLRLIRGDSAGPAGSPGSAVSAAQLEGSALRGAD